jgi:hypothetical protein
MLRTALIALALVAACPAPPPEGVVPPLTTASAAPPPPPRCEESSRRPWSEDGCTLVRAHMTASATAGNESAPLGIDDDVCTLFNAGAFAPQTYTVQFDEPIALERMVVVPAMTPTEGDANFTVEDSNDGVTWRFRAYMTTRARDGDAIGIPLGYGLSPARTYRIRTERSTSWVAWREVRFATCIAPPAPPPGPPRPPPPPPAPPPHRVLPGTGVCKSDADCHPVGGCCARSECSSIPDRTNCALVGACANPCEGPLACGAGHCMCQNGKCAIWTTKMGNDPFER